MARNANPSCSKHKDHGVPKQSPSTIKQKGWACLSSEFWASEVLSSRSFLNGNILNCFLWLFLQELCFGRRKGNVLVLQNIQEQSLSKTFPALNKTWTLGRAQSLRLLNQYIWMDAMANPSRGSVGGGRAKTRTES